MPRWLKYLISFFAFLLLVAIACLQPVDRTPYQEHAYYQQMLDQIDDLYEDRFAAPDPDTLLIGWSAVNITPDSVTPLAGFGGRNPKEFESIADSIYIRTIVFDDGINRVAYVSADLLILPPEVTQQLRSLLPKVGWDLQRVFLTATHSHSSIGGWAPGLVGHQIAGEYDPELPLALAKRIISSIQQAESNLASGQLSFQELQVPNLVKNRLAKQKGEIDPSLKIIGLRSGDEQGYLTTFAAHPTSLSRHNHMLSGDFPGRLVRNLEQSDSIQFVLYAAGAVGSMGPRVKNISDEYARMIDFGDQLTTEIGNMQDHDAAYVTNVSLRFWRLPLEIRPPFVKISRNIALKPWLFYLFFGEYPIEVSFLQLGTTIFIGLPGDFSGELALPLYESANKRGLNLVINSFNGGYIGYIIKDQWYNLTKYEARTMSWYGPDNGAYISNVIDKIIEKITLEE